MGVVDVSERTLYLGWVLEVGFVISVMLGVGGWGWSESKVVSITKDRNGREYKECRRLFLCALLKGRATTLRKNSRKEKRGDRKFNKVEQICRTRA